MLKCLGIRQYSKTDRINKDVTNIIKAGKQYNETVGKAFPTYASLYLSFKFLTETANCATVVGLYFKIAPLLINSLSSLRAICQYA